MGTTLDQALNFIIPIAVWLFIVFIIYRIPLVKDGVTKLLEKYRDWRDNRESKSLGSVDSITYE